MLSFKEEDINKILSADNTLLHKIGAHFNLKALLLSIILGDEAKESTFYSSINEILYHTITSLW